VAGQRLPVHQALVAPDPPGFAALQSDLPDAGARVLALHPHGAAVQVAQVMRGAGHSQIWQFIRPALRAPLDVVDVQVGPAGAARNFAAVASPVRALSGSGAAPLGPILPPLESGVEGGALPGHRGSRWKGAC